MAYDIKLVKLINGEMVLGKFAPEADVLKDVALLQTVPTQQGAQMMILPFGYPFDTEVDGEISMKHVLYQYKNCPEELKTKYLEASSNLTLSTPGNIKNVDLTGAGSGNISNLFKK